MALRFWLTHPRAAISRVRYRVWELRNPDKPWLCAGTVIFCENHLSDSMRAIEFGSGRSTRWFADRVAHLTSIEHDRAWYATVAAQLAEQQITNIDYRLIELDHPATEPEQEQYAPLPRYVSVIDEIADRTLGLAIVDGHYRTTCVRHLIPKLAPGGFLLVDDVQRWPSLASLPIPGHWPVVDDSTNGIKRSTIWQVR